MNITNISGADTITAVQQTLTPLSQTVLGVNVGGNQILLGMIILILTLAFGVVMRLGLDAMFYLVLVATYLLSASGMLPAIVGSIDLMIVSVIILFSLYQLLRK